MKRLSGYYATQRRHGRARAQESPLRRVSTWVAPPSHRRFVTQSHAVGREAPAAGLVGVTLVLAMAAALATAWIRRR